MQFDGGRVLRYPLKGPLTEIALPKGATVLKVDFTVKGANLWAHIPKEYSGDETRFFAIIATGEEMLPREGREYEYVGTFLMDGGVLVWHVFEIVEAT